LAIETLAKVKEAFMSDKRELHPQTADGIQRSLERLDLDPRPFASIFQNDEDIKRVFLALEAAIFNSFVEDVRREPFGPMAQRLATGGISAADMKARFQICERWVRKARGDLGMGIEKTLDLMGHALRCELDGTEFDPTTLKTKIWTPT